GPLGKIQGALSGAGELGRIASGLPAIATRAVAVIEQMEIMSRDGLRLDAASIAAIARARARQSRWRTVGIWVIAITFLGILWSVR
ncbi:MAG: ubiquinone biosynthesis protein UbiB, partial [Tardiphaga sp.]